MVNDIGIKFTARQPQSHGTHAKTPPSAPRGPTLTSAAVPTHLPFSLLEDTVDKHIETIGIITMECSDPSPSHTLRLVLKRDLEKEKEH